eukprot:TRINITY_DN49730_c0_g1_i1.p1 TRINITY_DN49730_c0_g1~~TRINITY_DN49730_c0_g1_i1.p1  ORF type:complete len:355 (+),score=133.55 TRINITY_DN49730_c0_g1_i1:70-1134(+)
MKSVAVAVLVTLAGAVKEAPIDPLKIKLPVVPKVENAGYAGFPEVPGVDSMMESASIAMQGIKSKAEQLQEKMMQAQKQSSLRLKKQKAIFDQKLKEQEEKNQVIVRANKAVAAKVMEASKANQEEHAKALRLKEEGQARRKQLYLLQEELHHMQHFLAESLALEDKKVPQGDVLQGASLVQKDQPAKSAGDATNDGLSFLSLGQTFKKESDDEEEESTEASSRNSEEGSSEDSSQDEPESLVSMLNSAVQDMKKEGQETEHKLKDLFMSNFKSGAHRKKMLLEQQKVLKSSWANMDRYKARLETAERGLEEKASKSTKRMHAAGRALKKLGELAEAPSEVALSELSDMQAKKR